MSIFHARRAALTRARRLIYGFAALSALGQSPVRMCRTAFIPLLHERLTRSESGASLRMALCGAAAPFLIPHSKHWGGSGSYAIFIPLLHSHCPRSESGVYPRAAVCGAVAAFLIPHSEFLIPHSPLPFSTKKGGASPSRLFCLMRIITSVSYTHLRAHET